jgi:putative heme degradation protein
MKYKSKKIAKNTYQVLSDKKRISINAYQKLCIVKHKGRWIVALTEDTHDFKRVFKSCHTINRTQALNMILFLSDYVNLVKPTEATSLIASLKASNNRTLRVGKELAAIALNTEADHAE